MDTTTAKEQMLRVSNELIGDLIEPSFRGMRVRSAFVDWSKGGEVVFVFGESAQPGERYIERVGGVCTRDGYRYAVIEVCEHGKKYGQIVDVPNEPADPTELMNSVDILSDRC